jgi:hypothetical protein
VTIISFRTSPFDPGRAAKWTSLGVTVRTGLGRVVKWKSLLEAGVSPVAFDAVTLQ